MLVSSDQPSCVLRRPVCHSAQYVAHSCCRPALYCVKIPPFVLVFLWIGSCVSAAVVTRAVLLWAPSCAPCSGLGQDDLWVEPLARGGGCLPSMTTALLREGSTGSARVPLIRTLDADADISCDLSTTWCGHVAVLFPT